MTTTNPYWDGQRWLHWDGQVWLAWDGQQWAPPPAAALAAAAAAPPPPPAAAAPPPPPTAAAAAPPAPPAAAAAAPPPPSGPPAPLPPPPAAGSTGSVPTAAVYPSVPATAAPAATGRGGRVAALVAGGLALVLVAGGGAYLLGSRNNQPSGSNAATSATANGVEAKSAEQILAAAKAAALAQSSVHLKTVSSSTTAFDLTLSKDAGGYGSITRDGGPLEVVSTPSTLYMKSTAAEWESRLNAKAAAVIGTKWVSIPTSDSAFSQTEDLFAYAKMLEGILSPSSAIAKGQTGTFDGQSAVGLTSSDGTLWVATTGQPLPLGVEQGSGNKATFTDWGAPVTVPIPPTDQVISIDDVKAQAGG